MMISRFSAAVQYGDWRGDCVADDADFDNIRNELRRRELIRDGDFVIGFRLFNGENSPQLMGLQTEIAPVYLHALVIRAERFEEAQLALRSDKPVKAWEVDVELEVLEFVKLFKRISIAMGWQDLKVVDRDFEIVPVDGVGKSH